MGKIKDMVGKRFGKLTCIEYVDVKNGHARWKVLCDCGTIKVVEGSEMRRGSTISCGCVKRERLKLGPEKVKTHGMSGSRTYSSWHQMLQRCKNPNNSRYHQYGGRGIKVCEQWERFENFFADMGFVPQGMSIDRINNDGNYEPGNCRWATSFEQSNNMKNNVRLKFNGETKTVSEIAKITGIKKVTIYTRFKRGWPLHKLFDSPKCKSPKFDQPKEEAKPKEKKPKKRFGIF